MRCHFGGIYRFGRDSIFGNPDDEFKVQIQERELADIDIKHMGKVLSVGRLNGRITSAPNRPEMNKL